MRKLMSTTLAIMMMAGMPVCVLAEGYSPELLGESFRDYSGKKIQEGYYPEIFTKIDMRQQHRIAARNQAERVVEGSYQAGPFSNYAILSLGYLQQYNAAALKQEIQKFGKQRIANASTISEFTYLPSSDGKVTYFKDGLTSRVINERMVNEFGVVSLKNTFNMKYNDDRLLTGYEADVTDNLGNVSHLLSKDMSYMPGAKFYANEDTNAHRNMAGYTLIETDPAGNISTSAWEAGSYDGKLLRAFSVDSKNEVFGDQPYTSESTYERHNIVYENNDPNQVTAYEETGVMANGRPYRLVRSGISYNDLDQVLKFHEERWDLHSDGTEVKTTTDAEYEYTKAPHLFLKDVDPDPNRVSKTTLITTTEHPDGAVENETKVLNYKYDNKFVLTGGSGTIERNGKVTPSIEYRDAEGHTLSTTLDEEGNVTGYYYTGADDKPVEVAQADVIEVLIQDTFEGSGTISFEAVAGMPMPSKQEITTQYYYPEGGLKSTTTNSIEYTNGLVVNMPKVISYREISTETSALEKDDAGNSKTSSRDVTVTNIYDSLGNQLGASGTGTGSGYEFTQTGWKHFTDKISITYGMVNGYLHLDDDTTERIYE